MVLDKIKRLLDDRDWTVYELAKRSNIPQSTLSNMFNRSTYPSIPTLEAICKAFDITMSEFFSNDDVKDMLSPIELQLLDKWNTLPKEKQTALWELIKHY